MRSVRSAWSALPISIRRNKNRRGATYPNQQENQDASGTTTQRAALIASHTFDTGIGDFGVLRAVASAWQ